MAEHYPDVKCKYGVKRRELEKTTWTRRLSSVYAQDSSGRVAVNANVAIRTLGETGPAVKHAI